MSTIVHFQISSPAVIYIQGSMSATQRKIEGFSKLKYGWAYGRGVNLGQKAMSRATELNAFLNTANVIDTDAFPGEDGTVELAIYGDNVSIYALIGEESYTITSERNGEEQGVRSTRSNAEAFRYIWVELSQCALSASQVQNTTNNVTTDFEGWHFKSPQVTERLRLSNASVFVGQSIPSALTYKNSTQIMSPGTRPYSLRLSTRNFLSPTNLHNIPARVAMSVIGT